jgi:hypothetical protein
MNRSTIYKAVCGSVVIPIDSVIWSSVQGHIRRTVGVSVNKPVYNYIRSSVIHSVFKTVRDAARDCFKQNEN